MARLSEGEAVDHILTVFADPAGAGDNSLLAAPGVGWKYAVYGYQIANNAATANTVRFRSAANSKTSAKNLAGNAGTNIAPGQVPLFECNDNEALNLNLSAATAVGVDVQYAKVRV